MKFLVFLGAVTALYTVGCTTIGHPLPRPGSRLEQAEARLLQRVKAEKAAIEKSGRVYRDHELEAYLLGIIAKLQRDALTTSPFRIRLIRDPYLDAFAFPDGTIYIHTGILARLDNEAQLAALLAHEMIHCLHAHSLKATPGRIRALEMEADLAGLELMAEAGYDTLQAVGLFEHLAHELETEELAEPLLGGTHPKLRKRIETCKRFRRLYPPSKGLRFTGEALYLQKTRRLILDTADLDLKAGRYESARRGVDKYLKIDPTNSKAFFLLGEIFRQRGESGDHERAKASYGRAIALNPIDAGLHKSMGMLYFKEGAWQLARKSFESCLTLGPNASDRAYVQEYLRDCRKMEIDS
jgi:tetratricopeptide (TPR) repeat protein